MIGLWCLHVIQIRVEQKLANRRTETDAWMHLGKFHLCQHLEMGIDPSLEVVLNKHQPSSPHLKKENVSIYVFSHYQVCCLVKCLFRRPPCSSRSLLSPELLSGGDRCMKTVHNAIRLCSIHTLMRIRIAMILIIQHFSSSQKSVFNIIVKSKQSHFYLFIWPT